MSKQQQTSYFQVADLHVSYGEVAVVQGLTLGLHQGEIGCLLGFSGCGKTTALRAIAGLERAERGTVVLDDEVLTNQSAGKLVQVAPAKRGMGMVFQDYALFGHLTVAKNIAFGLHRWSAAEREERVAEMLALVALEAYADKKPDELSGGQQQRVALARALAPRPKLLLLDEPFSNLDVVLRESLAMSVREILKKTHTTAILVTHDQHEAFALADKVGVMAEGRLVQWSTPQRLYHHPATPFVADFVGEGALVSGVIREGWVETALGVLAYRPNDVNTGLASVGVKGNGEKVQVLVRPEHIWLNTASQMTARVVGQVFRGASYLYQLELRNGEVVLALLPSVAYDVRQGSYQQKQRRNPSFENQTSQYVHAEHASDSLGIDRGEQILTVGSIVHIEVDLEQSVVF